MDGAADEFFAGLGRRGHEPLLEHVTGVVRFDIVDADGVACRYVVIKRGDIDLPDDCGSADCVLRGSRALFDGICGGEINPLTALLRGELTAQGDVELMVVFQRVFPRRGELARAGR